MDKDLDNLFSDAFSEHESPVPEDMWQRVQTGKDEALDNLFSNALKQHESPVPEDMWHRINNPVDAAFDKTFTDAFTNHEMPVPANLWDRVNPNKDEDNDKVIAWRRWFMAAALLLFIGGVSTWYNRSFNSQKLTAQTAIDKTNKDKQAPDKALESNAGQGVTTGDLSQAATDSNNAMKPATDAITTLNDGVNTVGVNKITSAADRTNNSKIRQQNNRNILLNPSGSSSPNNVNSGSNNFNDLLTAQNSQNGTPSMQQQRKTTALDAAKNNDSASVIAQQHKNTMAVDSPKIPTANTVTTAKIQPVKTSKWSLEILASGHYANKQTYQIAEAANRLIESAVKASTPSLWSYGGGVRIGRTIGKHFTLKTGVQYLQTQQRIAYREYLFPTVNVAPQPTSSLAVTYRDKVLHSSYKSINVPILLTYETGKKIKVGVTGGVVINATSFYKGAIPNMTQTDTLKVADIYKNNTGVAVYLGVSMAKNIGNVTLFAEPHALLSLQSYTKPDVPFKQKINNYGISVGVRTSLYFGKKKK